MWRKNCPAFVDFMTEFSGPGVWLIRVLSSFHKVQGQCCRVASCSHLIYKLRSLAKKKTGRGWRKEPWT